MFGLFFLLFTVVPALELYLLFTVGAEIGFANTILIIILTGIVGAALAKSQGLAIYYKIQNELARGAVPTHQFVHGLMVFGGGLLLLTPGFLTDILGFSMVFPGTRHMIAEALKRYFAYSIKKGVKSGNVQFHVFGQRPDGSNYQYHSTQQSTSKSSEEHLDDQGNIRQVGPNTFEVDK